MKKIILLTILIITFSSGCFSACTSNVGGGWGNWNAASSWSCAPESAPPGCVSLITILAGDSIYIKDGVDLRGCGPINLVIEGQLGFKTGKKLYLDDGSIVEIKPGGAMSPGGGGGSSNFLNIGGNDVWTAADGRVVGPLSYDSGGVLPIELVSFEANVNDDRVDIVWVTSTEINNDYFTIERSIDAKNWEEILTISGAGNSNQTQDYFEVDYEPLTGLSYYRLKQTDYNGKFEYFNIVPVKFEEEVSSENGTINLFPSPVRAGETVNIEFKDIYEEELLIVMRDIKGREFYSKMIMNIEDGKLIGVPIDSSIPSGVYLITAASENQLYSQKLIVK
jgi:hypothetical protein